MIARGEPLAFFVWHSLDPRNLVFVDCCSLARWQCLNLDEYGTNVEKNGKKKFIWLVFGNTPAYIYRKSRNNCKKTNDTEI